MENSEYSSMTEEVWSIGIYCGDSPFTLADAGQPDNPVLTRSHVTDVRAGFAADPFMLRRDGLWHLFFEVWNLDRQMGEIGLAVSRDAKSWNYRQIVLREPFHLSYPLVFAWQGGIYMIPETLALGAIQLYRALDFPDKWTRQERLVEGSLADPTPFFFEDRWWMLACSTPYRHETLRLYQAQRLQGPWREHPRSPLIQGDRQHARPAGRVIVWKDRPVRFAQDCTPRYGSRVRAFEINCLTTRDYLETELPQSPVLQAAGRGWNRSGMHHVDAHPLTDGSWTACVDGFRLEGRETVRPPLPTS